MHILPEDQVVSKSRSKSEDTLDLGTLVFFRERTQVCLPSRWLNKSNHPAGQIYAYRYLLSLARGGL